MNEPGYQIVHLDGDLRVNQFLSNGVSEFVKEKWFAKWKNAQMPQSWKGQQHFMIVTMFLIE